MKFVSILFAFSLSLMGTNALWCWHCVNERTNENCMKNGRKQECLPNEHACHNEIRRGDDGIRITKRCKQDWACHNNQIQNPRSAWDPSQCNSKTPSSVCRCCCSSNGCNTRGIGCQQAPTCETLETPLFGRKDCQYSENENEIGSVCVFRCNENYDLVGSPESVCKYDDDANTTASFENPTPTCTPVTRAEEQCPALERPSEGSLSCTDGRMIRSVCSFRCNEKRILVGKEQIFCEDDATWSDVLPACLEVTCPRRRAPSNGDVSCSEENIEGSQCSYTCDDGYAMVGNPTSICLDDDSVTGVWSDDVPVCQRKRCPGQPTNPENGYVVCSDGDYLHSRCEFACNDYHRRVGTLYTECVEIDGVVQWNPSSVTCKAIECDDQEPPLHGTISCTNENFVNSVCSFECNEDRFLVGNEQILCQEDATWSDVPPACLEVTCQERAAPSNGDVSCSNDNYYGSECSYTCDDDYTIIGNPTSICLGDDSATGVWSTDVPVCEPIQCEQQEAPLHGTMSCTNENLVNSVCSFECNEKRILVGNQQILCEEEATWSDVPPACLQITCPERAAPSNGDVSCSDGNNEGSQCSYTCDDGYGVVGSSTSICLGDDSVTGVWSTDVPVCENQRCFGQPTSSENGNVVCSDGDYLHSRCEFACNDYHRRVGTLYTECVEIDGVVQWDPASPTCEAIQCNNQVSPLHGSMTCTDENNVNSVCSFACDSDHVLMPDFVLENTCLNDTTWSLPRPCCSRICEENPIVDLIVAIDSSSSIGAENWETMIDFVETLINVFEFGLNGSRFGIFRYNREIDVDSQILLRDYPDDTPGLIQALHRIPYDGSGTFTGQALRHALEVMLAPENGNRPEVSDAVIVITDGRAYDNIGEVSVRLHERDIHVYAIGVLSQGGRLDEEQLNTIVSAPDDLVIARSGFEGLNDEVFRSLRHAFCVRGCVE